MTSIYTEVCKRLGHDGTVIYPEPSFRAQRIIAHYDRTLARSHRQHDRLYIQTLVAACMSNLAGANGSRDTTQRTRITL